MKNKIWLILLVSTAVSTFSVFMGNTTDIFQFCGNITGSYITFYIFSCVLNKIKPHKDNKTPVGVE